MVDIELIKKEISYDPLSGELRWKVIKNCRKNPIGSSDDEGYLIFKFMGKALKCHRVAFAITYGRWPDNIDHINRVKNDNRLINIRECTKSENLRNRTVFKKNKTGVKGLHLKRLRNGYQYYYANVAGNGVKIGKTFKFNEDGKSAAIDWLDSVRNKLHKDFSCK